MEAAPTEEVGKPQTLKAAMETPAEAETQSTGCVSCHTKTDEATMHPSGTATLGGATCHGGDPKVSLAAGVPAESNEYQSAKKKAHPQPRVPDLWTSSANHERASTERLGGAPQTLTVANTAHT